MSAIKHGPAVFFNAVGLLAAWLFFASQLAVAAPFNDPPREPVDGHQIDYLIDASSDLTIDDLLKEASLSWRRGDKATLSFGYTPDAHWFRFELQPDDRSRVLELGYALLDDVQLFVVDGQQIISSFTTGDQVPFAERPILHRFFLFPVAPNDQSLSIYLRVKTSSSLQLPLTLWPEHAFFEADQHSFAGHGLYYGIVLVMSLYNLFLFLRLRNANYALYVIYVLSFSLCQFSISGFAYQFIWPDSPVWNQKSISVLVPAVVIPSTIFAANFLRLNQGYPWLHRGLLLLSVAGVMTTSLSLLLPYSVMIKYGIGLAILTCLYLLVISVVVALITRHKYAIYFAAAWSVFLMGAVVLSLNKFGILPRSVYTESSAQIGSAIEIILLSFALAERLYDANKSRLKAEQQSQRVSAQLLQTQRQQNVKLEQEVAERTSELSHALQQVKSLNEELTRLSRVDQLTGIFNRRHFEYMLDQEFRRGRRNQVPLSLVMVDLDHFKEVNDTFGHQAGDECLRRVSQLILDNIRRPPDVVCRYGGEEIVMILPETNEDGALYLANRIREKISKLEIPVGDRHMQITASMGLCSALPTQHFTHEEMLAVADRALYVAKDGGRNQVVAERIAE